MTNEKAVETLKKNEERRIAGIYLAIKSLAISALEKQIPKKAEEMEREYDGYYGICPNCKNVVCDDRDFRYCNMCGQALDWSDTNDNAN